MTAIKVNFKLLECFLYHPQTGFCRLEAHLARLKNSAQTLGFYYNHQIPQALNLLAQDYQSSSKAVKVRLQLNRDGQFHIDAHDIVSLDPLPKIKLYLDERVNQHDPLYYHKTDGSHIRNFYNRVYNEQSDRGGYCDIILANRDGFICEGTRCNIFIRQKNIWLTPAIDCGLIPGVMRNDWLKKNRSIQATYITIEQLKQADEIVITNSVRGKIGVRLCHKNLPSSFDS